MKNICTIMFIQGYIFLFNISMIFYIDIKLSYGMQYNFAICLKLSTNNPLWVWTCHTVYQKRTLLEVLNKDFFVAIRLWFKIFIKSTRFRLLVCSLQWAGFATDWHSKARRSDKYFKLNMNNPALLQTSLNLYHNPLHGVVALL
jgi:hypothetical protein